MTTYFVHADFQTVDNGFDSCKELKVERNLFPFEMNLFAFNKVILFQLVTVIIVDTKILKILVTFLFDILEFLHLLLI